MTFGDLLEKSVIVSTYITVVLVGVCAFLWCTGQPVPDLLATALMLVLGFFFGAKMQKVASQTR